MWKLSSGEGEGRGGSRAGEGGGDCDCLGGARGGGNGGWRRERRFAAHDRVRLRRGQRRRHRRLGRQGMSMLYVDTWGPIQLAFEANL